MAIKKPKPKEIVVKLRQVEVLMVQGPCASFHVAIWGVFWHLRILQIHPARFNRV